MHCICSFVISFILHYEGEIHHASSFVFIAVWYSIVRVYRNIVFWSTLDGYWSYFQLQTSMDDSVSNTLIRIYILHYVM